MPHIRNFFALAAVVTAICAAPVAAQDYDGTIGYGGGGIMFTDFNAGGPGESFGLGSGWVATAHIDHWVDRGRLGGRINAAFTRRPTDVLGDSRNIHTWIVGGDLLLRLLPSSPNRTVVPFIAGGAGMVSYGLGAGNPVNLDNARYPGNSDRKLAVSAGIGFDIVPRFTIFGTPSGFRLEVIDHMALESPFEPIGGGDFDPVHNVRASLSLIGLVDLLR